MSRSALIIYSFVFIFLLMITISYVSVHRLIMVDNFFTAMDTHIFFDTDSSSPLCSNNISLSIYHTPVQNRIFSSGEIDEYMKEAKETVAASSFSNKSRAAEIESIIAALRNMTFEEQTYVTNTLNGREFPYPLSCPNTILPSSNYSIVVAYHIGMMNNWRDVVADQLTTIEVCGLGKALKKMIITYSSKNPENDFYELTRIINRYSFTNKVAFHNSADLFPYEGLAMNLLHDYCLEQEDESVAFYIHNKGVSHYSPKWKDRKMLDEWGTYANVLFWRKYLEYFLIERPGICIDHIVNGGADACGAHLMTWPDSGFRFFDGNFWAVSCNRHVKTLKKIELGKVEDIRAQGRYNEKYGEAEGWINRPVDGRMVKMIGLHDHDGHGLYDRPIPLEEYSDYSHRYQLPKQSPQK